MLDGAKYLKRYKHLELCFIMVGMESGGQTFTEMLYLTREMLYLTNPQGMTHIAACLQKLRLI